MHPKKGWGKMSRTRSRVVFLLLILILLAVSIVLGLLPWWLGEQTSPQDRGAGSDIGLADGLTASAFLDVAWVTRWTG